MKHIIIDKGKYHSICTELLDSGFTLSFFDRELIKNTKAGCEIPGTQLIIEDYEMSILLHCYRLYRRTYESSHTDVKA